MDNVFTQILIQEIENLNLRYSQLTLTNYKITQFKKENPNTEEYTTDKKEIITTLIDNRNAFLDEIRVSITQILMRIEPIADKIKLTDELKKNISNAGENFYNEAKDEDLTHFLTNINKIYVNNLISAKVENISDTIRNRQGA